MKKTLIIIICRPFIFLLIPLITSAQSNISVNIIERTDAKKDVNTIFNYSIERFINKKMSLGINNYIAKADYIRDGYNPIQDSLVISNYQIFSKYYLLNNFYLIIQSPLSTNYDNISALDRIRVGGGYHFYIKNNITYYICYNILLNRNENRFRKGKLNIGFSFALH